MRQSHWWVTLGEQKHCLPVLARDSLLIVRVASVLIRKHISLAGKATFTMLRFIGSHLICKSQLVICLSTKQIVRRQFICITCHTFLNPAGASWSVVWGQKVTSDSQSSAKTKPVTCSHAEDTVSGHVPPSALGKSFRSY